MTSRLIVISDIHGTMKAINGIHASVKKYKPDMAVICGDITHFGDKRFAEEFLDKISIPVLGVTGNCDPAGIEEAYQEVEGDYLHLTRVERQGISFLGLSGSNYKEEEIKEFSEKASGVDVWVLHSPPLGYLDEASRGKNIGEEALLPIIKKRRPRLVLSGHVHEERGIRREDTIFVNPGPAFEDNYAIVDVGERIRAKLV